MVRNCSPKLASGFWASKHRALGVFVSEQTYMWFFFLLGLGGKPAAIDPDVSFSSLASPTKGPFSSEGDCLTLVPLLLLLLSFLPSHPFSRKPQCGSSPPTILRQKTSLSPLKKPFNRIGQPPNHSSRF